jgi:hypothetical protein
VDKRIHEPRRDILRFLDEAVLIKDEKERTQLDDLLLEAGRAFTDALVRYARGTQARGATGAEASFTRLARGFNAINREYAIRNQDAEALATFREPFPEPQE